MLSREEKQKVIDDLRKCDTVGDVLRYVQKNYEVDSCKLSIVTKPLFIEGMIKALNLTNPKKKV